MKENKDRKDFKSDSLNDDNSKGKRSFKGRKPKGKTRDNSMGRDNKFESFNDFAWYNQNPQLAKDVSQISYSQPLGLRAPYNIMVQRANSNDPTKSSKILDIAAVGVVQFLPGIGISTEKSSPVNIAAQLVYTFIRHANAGSRNYEAPDYMTYLLAVNNLYIYYAELVRVYGILNTWSYNNRAIPKMLIQALGYDYDDLVLNMAAFRMYINQFAVKANTFATPKSFSFYDRGTYLVSNVFKDSKNDKSQLYVFRPRSLYMWSGTTYTTGSALIATNIGESRKLVDIIEYGNALLNALLFNEDIGVMSGDTLKAFGSNIRQLAGIPDTYATMPVYDEGALSQIHNMTIVGNLASVELESGDNTFKAWDIYQQDGALIYNPYFTPGHTDGIIISDAYILDCGMDDPTVEYNMEATRLQVFKDPGSVVANNAKGHVYKLLAAGTEIVTGFTVYKVNSYPTADLTITDSFQDITTPGAGGSNKCSSLTAFDWAPILYPWSTSPTVQSKGVFGQTYNWTTIKPDTLARMHEVALQSLFNVSGLYVSKV